METTRRDFIRNVLLFGGTLLLSPGPLYAAKKEEGFLPAYAKLEQEGKFAEKVEQAYAIFEECQLCPRGLWVRHHLLLQLQSSLCLLPELAHLPRGEGKGT